MRPEVLHTLIKHALMIIDEREVSERTKQIKEETVKLLCLLCTVKSNRFYIPGETKLVERLKKDAFDKGIFATLTFLYNKMHHSGDGESSSSVGGKFNEIKKYIKEKVLNPIELADLVYHAGVIDQLIDLIKKDPNYFKNNI